MCAPFQERAVGGGVERPVVPHVVEGMLGQHVGVVAPQRGQLVEHRAQGTLVLLLDPVTL